MNKYESLKRRLDAIIEMIEEMQDIVYLGNSIDAVDSFTFDTVIGMYLKFSVQADELKKLIEGVLRCKNDTDRLTYYLNNIYSKSAKQN